MTTKTQSPTASSSAANGGGAEAAADSRPPRDWFVAAIEANGSVGDCLGAVLAELERRAAFVKALKTNLEGSQGPRGADSVTELGQKVRSLENTLRFRLGILRPERSAAWFRSSATTNTGPFTRSLIDEPVFSPYDEADAGRVREGLARAWQQRTIKGLPFRDDSACLWRTLLGLNTEHARIVAMPAPFEGFRLDELPDGLPAQLDSRALRAFLLNVRNEVKATRERLDACFGQLFATCEKFWEHQQGVMRVRTERSSDGRAHAYSADQVRAEFKRRRQEAQTRLLLTAAEIDALRFMGFDELPPQDALRQRYIDMAKKLHPDRMGGRDEAFKTLSGAYARLTARYEAR